MKKITKTFFLVFYIFSNYHVQVIAQKVNVSTESPSGMFSDRDYPGTNRAVFDVKSTNSEKFIRRQGRQIIDSTGKPVQLRGVNLGGWLLWEAWIWGGGLIGETPMMNSLSSIAGSAEAGQFKNEIHENFITEPDITAISQSCYNVVRIAFNHSLLEEDSQPYTYKQSGWNVLDSVLSWCEKHNVYAVLDLHAAPGGQNAMFISDPDADSSLWNGINNQQRTIKLWGAIANRYKDRTIIAGYDLLNEPSTPWFEEWKLVDIYKKIISEIRAVDSNHMVILEGNNYAKDFWMFTAPPDSNMSYSFHVYTWFGEDPKAIVAGYQNLIEQQNVPMWCGEWGENNNAILDSTRDAMEDTANKISGWAFWTWKKVSDNQTALNAIQATAAWTKLIKWVSDSVWNPKPSYSEAMQGISEFLNAIKYENTIRNPALNTLLSPCSMPAKVALTEQKPDIINLFPVPSPYYINIEFPGMPAQKISWIISDINGKKSGEGMFQEPFCKINISLLQEGIYFIRLSDGVREWNKRFVVAR